MCDHNDNDDNDFVDDVLKAGNDDDNEDDGQDDVDVPYGIHYYIWLKSPRTSLP